MCHQPWPWPHSPLADERRAARPARIAVLVVGGRIEVGGPWPHSPLAYERLPLGSQSLSVVVALRSAGGLLRRGSGQLKVGLLVLGLVREQHCNAPVRTGSRRWTYLTTTARTLSWSFIHAPGLGVGGAGGSQRKFLSWRCARCTARSANRCWSCARRWSASCQPAAAGG